MKYIFTIIVLLHALIHLLGFLSSFALKEVKELTLPISKPAGLFWLTAAVLFLIFGVLYFCNNKYSWLVGFTAIALSQVLIIAFWQDAKFGTLLNIIILVLSIMTFEGYTFQKRVLKETSDILSQCNLSTGKVITENDIANLPEPVKKWLRSSGVIGKPYITAGRVTQLAALKMKPDQQKWMNATALQYTTIDNPAFIWTVDVKMNSLLRFAGRDKFHNGKGAMLIKLNSLFTVVDEKGEKLDEGTIQRYLGEMVWFPTLALSQYVTWEQLDLTTAQANIEYKGTRGSGTFYFNSSGEFSKFVALRYMGNQPDAKRNEWVLLVDEYKTFEGIKVPAKMTATWKLAGGDWTWLKLEITDIRYNENAYH
ncbi:MAG: hypothetical protein JW857_07605 [Bacteroidales bacterium]|nr:hypothetical protein [Bacteroidales bacterium]